MSAIGVQSQINKDRALWLSSIPSDVIHGNIICDTILANAGYISTLYSDNINVSTLNVSTLSLTTSDVSGMYVSSLRGNTAFFSSLSLASDLSGGVGYVRFSVDASGIQVDGDPIRFDNLVYLTSSINIIQVSTLVDTDIFGSNGYFSTLSSGSLSTGQLQVQQGLFSSLQADYGSFNRLFVSSLEALDISGVDGAKYWSQYPTLTSSITFQPGFVLSNVNSNLFFAGQELTDVSGGGRDWSYFPAQTDVSMNNFSIRQLSTLQYQDGGRLYSQTGNNLFYNGLPVQFGNASNVSQWANYPAVNTIQTAGFPISSIGNLTLVSNSNIRILADRVSTVADNGIDIGTASRIDMTAQNGYQGVINMTANPGYQGLFGTINMTANGGTVAGVGTGGLISLTANTPLGTLCNATSAIKLSASGVNSYAGAVPPIGSLAGYNFIYGQAGVNIVASVVPPVLPNIPLTTYLYGDAGVTTSSDFYAPNIYPYWNGVTTPPDLFIKGRYITPNLAQVYVQMCNVKQINMDATALLSNVRVMNMSNNTGQIVGLSTINGLPFTEIVQSSNIVCSNITAINSISTAVMSTNSSFATTSLINFAQVSSFLMGNGLILSTTIGDLRFNNAKVADDITGVTNAPNPLQSRIINFSSINSFNMSTTDLWVSSINGQPIDISGSPFVNTNTFSTLFTSSLRVSTLVGYSYPGNSLSTVFVEGGFQFSGDYQGNAQSGRFLSSLRNINSFGEDLRIVGGGTGKEFALFYDSGAPASNQYVRIGGGSFFDTKITNFRSGGAVSTSHLFTSSIIGDPVGGLDLSGNLNMSGNINIPLSNAVSFDDGSFVNFSQFEYRDVANNAMVSLTNNPGLASNNMTKLGVGELWVTGGADQYSALRIYNVFPYDNFGLDIVDANGTTLFEAFACGQVPGGFLTEIAGVSSITGFNHIGGTGNAVGFDNIVTAPTISSLNLLVSSINGAPVDGGSFDNQFSTLYVSSLNFSTAYAYMSNTAYNYPLFIEADHAGATTTAGVAIAVQGHNLGTGQVRNQIEMGARGNGANYIMSSWPGQNLEDLQIDATDVIFNDGNFSTIVNADPFGLQTNGIVKVGAGSGVVTISTNNVKVGGQTSLTQDTISTTFLNTPYGNNLYTAGQRQPCIFHGTQTLPAGGGVTSSLITLATNYTTKDFDVQLTYKNQFDNSGLHWSTQTAGSFLAFGGSGKIVSWTTFGDLPFTG